MSNWIQREPETGAGSPLLARTADNAQFDPDSTLGGWLTTQAAMLYWFMTPDYLAPLAAMLRDLMAGRLDTLLALAETVGTLPFSNNAMTAWPHLTPNWTRHAPDMFGAVLQRVQQHMAAAPAGRHRPLGLDSLLCRLQDSYSDRCPDPYEFQAWATTGEANVIALAAETVGLYASRVDDTLYRGSNRWDDAQLAFAYPAFAHAGSPTPTLRLHQEIRAKTGQVPPRTGVYICLDVPHAAPQYGWTDGAGGRLLPANTFNAVGQAALDAVGRDALWRDNGAMLRFALTAPHTSLFREHLFRGGTPQFHLAPTAVACEAFTTMPGTWAFVAPMPVERAHAAHGTAVEAARP